MQSICWPGPVPKASWTLVLSPFLAKLSRLFADFYILNSSVDIEEEGREEAPSGNWPQGHYKLVWVTVVLLNKAISRNVNVGLRPWQSKKKKKITVKPMKTSIFTKRRDYFCFTSYSFFFPLHPWHVEIPGPGLESELQVWTTPLLWEHQILNSLCWAGDKSAPLQQHELPQSDSEPTAPQRELPSSYSFMSALVCPPYR